MAQTIPTVQKAQLVSREKIYLLASLLLPPVGLFLLLRSFKRGWRYSLTILAVSLAGIAGYWYLIAINSNSLTVPVKKLLYSKNYNVTYSQLEETFFNGAQADNGIKFLKPVEFNKTSEVRKSDSATRLYVQPNDSGKSIGFLAVSSAISPLAQDADYRANMANLLAQGSGSQYEQFISTFYSFIKDSTSPSFNVTLSKPVAFTNPYVHGDAWQFDVSAKSATNDQNKLTPLRGKFIVIIGHKAFYFFGLYTLNYNWQPNDSVWQQVEKSIQIDQ